ncbi:MAG: hypothetical protein IPK14_28315 [Blastocatellia bacterium]|nr:hypothetical protein [Blastocatellia bacterium]
MFDTVSLIRDRHQIKFGVRFFSFLITLERNRTLQPLKGGLAVFAPIDFAQASVYSMTSIFDGPATFDPAGARFSVQNNSLTAFFWVCCHFISSGFPANYLLISLALPAVFIQGFGNSNVSTQTNPFLPLFKMILD